MAECLAYPFTITKWHNSSCFPEKTTRHTWKTLLELSLCAAHGAIPHLHGHLELHLWASHSGIYSGAPILTPMGHGERGEALEERNSTSLSTFLKGLWDMLVVHQQRRWGDGRQLSTFTPSWGICPHLCPAAELGQAKGQEETASGCV